MRRLTTSPGARLSQAAQMGMTLLELLVGLVIMGAALSVGYAGFSGVAAQAGRAVRVMNETAQEALTRRSLVEWLRGARLAADQGDPPFTGLDRVYGNDPNDELAFLTTAPVFTGPGAAQIQLFIDRDDATPERGLVAVLTEWRGSHAERVELAPAATGLDIRYLFGFREHTWLPGWVSSTALPIGVELTITSWDQNDLPPLLQKPIVVALGGGR